MLRLESTYYAGFKHYFMPSTSHEFSPEEGQLFNGAVFTGSIIQLEILTPKAFPF
jgi:hypothetical protein